MSNQQTRRELMLALGAAATSSALKIRNASAQTGNQAMSNEFEYRTTRDLVAALASRKVSAIELLSAAIARIEKFDGRINAVVVRDFERARAAAAAADAALARGERRPLLGIPMTVKEAFNVAGLPTTWGSPRSRDWRPAEDAVTVARLKAAGAVILGKTNVPFALADWQSFNEIYGVTKNPWDETRTPGGSSGGSAASLAAGYVSLELGSDIGGSLRVPAHFCGVYAHKPTHALVPSRGHTPPGVPALPVEPDLVVVGPMARSAGDLALALELLAGPDEPVAVGYRLALPPARHNTLKDFRVLVINEHPLVPTAATIRNALDRFAGRLEKTGCKVARTSPLLPGQAENARVYMRLLFSFLASFWPIEQYRQLATAAAGLPEAANSLAAVRLRGMVSSHRDWVMADNVRAGIVHQWRQCFREWDVVVCPPISTVAYPHIHTPDRRTWEIEIDGQRFPYEDLLAWPGIATVPGLPATVIPIDRSENGLPIGAQIVGPAFEDRTTIAFAELVEREFGGFVAPPGFKN